MKTNASKMNLRLPRLSVIDLLLATGGIACDLRAEANDPGTHPDRARIAYESAVKWDRLHDELRRQLDEFDADK